MQQYLQNKKGLVENVFDQVYDQYDLMNDFMSLGIHRLWKKNLLIKVECPKRWIWIKSASFLMETRKYTNCVHNGWYNGKTNEVSIDGD